MKAIPQLRIRDNVALPFVSLYLGKKVPNPSLVGFIHTHPEPLEGYKCTLFSNEDLFLKRLPGIDYVSLAPYENQDVETK